MKIINENTIRKVLREQIEEISIDNVISDLVEIGCPGGSLKKLVETVLEDHGYEDIRTAYLGKDENNRMIYLAKTEGPIFVYKGHSKIEKDRPCLHIFDVQVYTRD